MFGQREDMRKSSAGQPSPAAGLVFVLGSFGFFYGLIAVLDPLL